MKWHIRALVLRSTIGTMPAEQPTWDVFLIHAGDAEESARVLAKELRQRAQARVFLRSDSLEPGVDIDREEARALAQAGMAVVLVTPGLEDTLAARGAIHAALRRRADDHTRPLVPVDLTGALDGAASSVLGLRCLQPLRAKDDERGLAGTAEILAELLGHYRALWGARARVSSSMGKGMGRGSIPSGGAVSARSVPRRKPQRLQAIGARTGQQVAEHRTSVRDRAGA